MAEAAAAAGLDGIVVTDRHRTDRLPEFVSALERAGVRGFAGVELALKSGTLVLIPRSPEDPDFADAEWRPSGEHWNWKEALSRVAAVDGAVLAGHPYCRDLGSVLGDRVYSLKGIAGVETRVGRGKNSWDRLADHAANAASAARLGSSGGDPQTLGIAATVVSGEVADQAALVDAILARSCLPVELDDPAAPKDRQPPPPRPRRDDDGGRGGRERGDRGRGERGGRGGDDRGRGGRGRPPGSRR